MLYLIYIEEGEHKLPTERFMALGMTSGYASRMDTGTYRIYPFLLYGFVFTTGIIAAQ